MKKVASCFMLVSAVMLIAACSRSSTPTTTPPVTDDEIANFSGNVITCTKDTDCVVIEIGCCDHCNGGEVASVNTAYAEQAREYHTGDCSEENVCTMMACADELPRCRDSKCEHYTDTSGLY